MNSMWVGLCHTPHGQLVVISETEGEAKDAIWREYRKHVYAGFCEQNGITNFETLNEWNGASVKELPVNSKRALIWERLS